MNHLRVADSIFAPKGQIRKYITLLLYMQTEATGEKGREEFAERFRLIRQRGSAVFSFRHLQV